jgi:hypothetical protein
MTDEFRNRILDGEQFDAGHWGVPGHQVIAEALEKRILRDQLIKR